MSGVIKVTAVSLIFNFFFSTHSMNCHNGWCTCILNNPGQVPTLRIDLWLTSTCLSNGFNGWCACCVTLSCSSMLSHNISSLGSAISSEFSNCS
nr:hypothetical protein Itr_chr09CG12780 [Ipomoea trifida]